MNGFLSSQDEIHAFFGCTPILYATLRITGLCNLNCKHCYASAGSDIDTSKELKLPQMLALLEELYRKGVRRLSISGGEPFCRGDVYTILQKASELGFDIYLSTNGTNNISVEKLSETNIKVLQVSLDGMMVTHDRIRGKRGAFSSAISFLEEMHRSSSISIGVAYSVMKENVAETVPLYNFIHDNSLSDIFSVIPVQKLGRARENDMLSPHELKKVFDELANCYLCSDKSVELNIMAPPAIVPVSIKNERFGNGYVCEFPYSVAIDAEGNCAICDGLLNLPEFRSGNICENKDCIDSIYTSETVKKWLGTSPENLEGICNRCSFVELCCGGCRVDAFLNSGRFYSSDPLCQHYYDAGLFPEEYLLKN